MKTALTFTRNERLEKILLKQTAPCAFPSLSLLTTLVLKCMLISAEHVFGLIERYTLLVTADLGPGYRKGRWLPWKSMVGTECKLCYRASDILLGCSPYWNWVSTEIRDYVWRMRSTIQVVMRRQSVIVIWRWFPESGRIRKWLMLL